MSKDFSDTKAEGDSRYNVVLKTLSGMSEGVVTRSTFENQSAFEQWYGKTMRDGTNRPVSEVYGVVEQGVSDTEAARIVSLPENTDAVVTSLQREARFYFGRAAQSLHALRP